MAERMKFLFHRTAASQPFSRPSNILYYSFCHVYRIKQAAAHVTRKEYLQIKKNYIRLPCQIYLNLEVYV
jgi:hypothetical protein